MPIVDGKYVAPTWVNGGEPAINATELNAMSGTVQENQENCSDLKSAFRENSTYLRNGVKGIASYVGKSNVCDLMDVLEFDNGYYNDYGVVIASPSQLCTNIIEIGTGQELSIKVPSGYRIYVQPFRDDHVKAPGAGWFTQDTTYTMVNNYVGFNVTKNPYSVADTISPSDASGFNIYLAVTPDANNLTKRVSDLEDYGYSYVGSIGSSHNIDNTTARGMYYVALADVQGTLPAGIDKVHGNGMLEVLGIGNFLTQRLTQLYTGQIYARAEINSGGWTGWDELFRKSDVEALTPMVQSRNLWEFGDQSVTGYKIIGTEGVALYPSGKYTLSFKLTADEEYINLNIYMSSGSINKQITPAPSGYRNIVQINASNSIERFFLQTKSGSSSAYSFDLEDVQFEKIYWSNYEYSDTSNWVAMPYTTPYVDHKIPANDKIAEYKSYWEGKKIIFNGDSITQGISVDGEGKVGYVRTACKLLKFGVVENYAIGGTRLAHVEGEFYCLVDRLNDMPTDADIIYIMANTNDYASQVPIGTDNSSDTSTYKGALNALFDWLKTNYPQKTIIISTQLTRKINTSGGEPLPITPEEYVQAVRDRVAAYHFVLFDAYALSGMDLRTSPQDGTGITNDGLHPNQCGAELLGRKVAAFINAQ